jgi:hypothetical protein
MERSSIAALFNSSKEQPIPKPRLRKSKPKPKPRDRIFNLKSLFAEPKPRKDFFDNRRTTNILNKLYTNFTKEEVFHLAK